MKLTKLDNQFSGLPLFYHTAHNSAWLTLQGIEISRISVTVRRYRHNIMTRTSSLTSLIGELSSEVSSGPRSSDSYHEAQNYDDSMI